MKSKQPPKSSPTFADPEVQQIEQLLEFMTKHNLEEFEYSRGDLHIRLRKPATGAVLAAPRAMADPEIIVSSAGSAAMPTALQAAAAAAEARATEDLHLVKSPIVGTFYGSPSPGSEPFVKVGAFVETGQTLCIVEAMKLMNEIESDETGEIVRIFVDNGQPVEYGQPLFGIRPSRKK
ncbi:MAG TPA: acetyl-CoA carboxylase biotin carboxyl carrier protein [Candidatus Acidoferrum sp.]|nr:acetyl-CoA carboxylase biotin carboxyl carrier protein [Candidatus Acidoferrum sp.]